MSRKNKLEFSDEFQSVDEIIEFFNNTKKSIESNKVNIIKNIKAGNPIPSDFIGMTMEELHHFFIEDIKELERIICLNLLSSIEAKFRMDYLFRVYNRKKDDLSRSLQKVFTEKKRKAVLEEDILENWKIHRETYKLYISDYKGALKYRNWLAHGRYWLPNFGRDYDLDTIYTICLRLEKNLDFE